MSRISAGARFGFYTVVEKLPHDSRNHTLWLCKCDCGTTKQVIDTTLKRTRAPNCGCQTKRLLHERHITHGRSKTLVYKAWAAMKERCLNPANIHFESYGGRGITVCERWRNSFADFIADMGERMSGCTLERIDNNGNYEPGNCKWATRREQQRNRRCNRILVVNGTAKCISAWAEEMGVTFSVISNRLSYGWSDEEAVLTPVRFRTKAKT